jgi:hypothetical protein
MANTLASTLINRALDNASRLGTTTTKSGTTLTNFGIDVLNRTMNKLSRKHDFRECRKIYSSATASSTRSYALPTGYKTIYDLRLIDGTSSRKLQQVQSQHFDDVIPYPESQSEGRPTWYIVYGHTFDVFPIPDAAYVMYMKCTIWPTTITATTDSVIYDSDKDDLLVYGMTEELFGLLQMHEDSAVYNAKFQVALKEAIDVDGKYPDWNPVARGFGFGRGVVDITKFGTYNPLTGTGDIYYTRL